MTTKQCHASFLVALLVFLAGCSPISSSKIEESPTPRIVSTPPIITSTPSPTGPSMPAECVILGCPLNLLPTESSATQTAVPSIKEDKFTTFDFSKIGKALQVAISPDGKALVASSVNGVWIFDIKTQTIIWNFELQISDSQTHFLPVAWSPDSKVLATGSSNGHIDLWNINSHQQVGQLIIEDVAVTKLSWSHDGKMLASTSMTQSDWFRGFLIVWDLGTQQSLWTIPVDHSITWKMDFSPDNSFIAVSNPNIRNGLRIWRIKDGKEIILKSFGNQYKKHGNTQNIAWHPSQSIPNPSSGGCAGIYDVKWSPDGKSMLTVEQCLRYLTIWDFESGQKKYSLKGADWLAVWSPNGKFFAFNNHSPNPIQVHLSRTGERVFNLSCPVRVPIGNGSTPEDLNPGDMIWVPGNSEIIAVNMKGEMCSWILQGQ